MAQANNTNISITASYGIIQIIITHCPWQIECSLNQDDLEQNIPISNWPWQKKFHDYMLS